MNEKKMNQMVKEYTASNLAAAILDLKGKPLQFDNYEPFRSIYDIDPDMMVFKAGRQIGKSVSLGGRLTIKSIGKPYFNSLYIAPFQIQSKRFSNAYLDAFMDSPLVKKYFRKTGDAKNVYEKTFSNGSTIYLSYAQTESDADRIRGIMADMLTVDEVQDISFDALPPVYEILNASDYGFKVMAGTSKSVSNTLEQLWIRSNQLEWGVKCDACNHWNIPHNFDACLAMCRHPEYPSCQRCGKRIDVNKGQWISTMPRIKNIIGFHLPQIIIGANCTEKKWPKTYDKIQSAMNGGLYTPDTLANEVFGLATDLSGKSLSMGEAMACSDQDWRQWPNPVVANNPPNVQRILSTIQTTVLGVDWSVTGSDKSFTVAVVLGYDHMGKCYLLASKKLQGIHILKQVDQVLDMARTWNVRIIASDRGVGVLQGQLMQKEYGYDRVLMCQYVAAKARLRWDSEGQFMAADRTQAIDNVMMKFRTGIDRFHCPDWTITEGYWKDALTIFEEETMVGKRVYRHHPDEPDDWCHAVVFGNIGYQYLTGDFTFTE